MGDFGGPEPQIVRFWGPPPQNGVVWGGSLTLPLPKLWGFGVPVQIWGGFLGSLICRTGGFWGPIFPPGYEILGGGSLTPNHEFFGVPHPRDGKFRGVPSPQIKIWGAPRPP